MNSTSVLPRPSCWRFWNLAAIATVSLCACGCNVGPRYHATPVTSPPEFKEGIAEDGTHWIIAASHGNKVGERWWEMYHDAELNQLEQQVNVSNQTIAQAYQNFEASRALVRQARSALYPSVGLSASYTRSRSPATLSSPGQNPNSNLFSAPVDVSWEADLWGRVRNQVREQANAAQVSAADLAGQRLTEQAALATDLFEIRGQDALIGLYQRTVAVDEDALRVTRVRYRTGLDNEETVSQAEITLRSAQAAVTSTKITRTQYEHAIALLVGQSASTFTVGRHDDVGAPPDVPVGVPSDLLQQRPDIAAAERTMAAANALIGVGRAAFYPSLTLGGSAGVQSTTIRQWFQWPGRFFSVGPTVSQTIFDGGLRRATVAQYQAAYDADVASYRQTVLVAFQQTEDALAATRLLVEEQGQAQQTVDSAQRYFDVASARYKTGLDPFLNVFSAQGTLLSSQQALLSIKIQRMTEAVQLIQVLGGGWDSTHLPSEKQVAAK